MSLVYGFMRVYSTYVVVNEALLLLDISNGGGDGDVVRQLLKITESQKRFHCNSLKFKPSVDVMKVSSGSIGEIFTDQQWPTCETK